MCCSSCSLSSFSFVLLIMTTSFFPLSSASNKNSQPRTMDFHEQETLYNIMETISSDQNWRVSHPDPCKPGGSWIGIECKMGNNNLIHVTRLDFGLPPNPTCQNSANFPSTIFQLPFLESVFFIQCFTHAKTTISFPIPKAQTFSSTSLHQLSIRSNPALLGSIPFQISSLKSLQILTLSQNSLTGQIPGSLFSLSSLVHLDLSYNLLTGMIPFQLGNLKNLLELDLSYNRLKGPIPYSIGQLEMLQKLDLSSNSLAGTIPQSTGNLHSLVFVALSSNKFHGNFFIGIPKLQNLQYFIMDDNPMFTSLPAEFSQLQKLQELRLSNSGYFGKIPAAYSNLTNLSTLSLQNNRLIGEIPASFGSLSHMYHLNLSINLLNGIVPFDSTFLRRLGKNLDLSGNPGLCLNSSETYAFNPLGVHVCGSTKSSSMMKPLKTSQAQQLISMLFSPFSSTFAIIVLHLHHILFCDV